MKKMSAALLLLIVGLIGGFAIENRLDISQIFSNSEIDMKYDGQVMEDDSLKEESESKEKKIQYWVAPIPHAPRWLPRIADHCVRNMG